ncbi:hypothetical protein ACYVVI_08720 [Arenicellales bacterium IMCC57338]
MNQNRVSDRLMQSFTARWFLLLLGIALSYAVIRYHIFAGVDWAHLPLFILNKALALAAVFFISMSYVVGKLIKTYSSDPPKQLILVKFCGLMGFSMAALHALMALLLFSPEYYPKFFEITGQLNITGELSMLFGILSLWCLSVTAITSLPFMIEAVGVDRWKRGQRLGYVSLLISGGHVLVMGLTGWLTPAGWHGYLPPVSLVAFSVVLLVLLVKIVNRGPR